MAGTFGLTIEQLATEMGVSVFTVYRLARKGLVKTIWMGSRKIVPAHEVERLRLEGAPTPRKAVGSVDAPNEKPA